MTPWVRVYYFMSGLVYPGALGVALTWLVQGVTLYVTGAPTRPPLWNVCFAVWFTVYHSLLYSRMLDRYDTWSSDPDQHKDQAYNGYALGSDVVDSLALFLAFGTLDFQFGTLSGT